MNVLVLGGTYFVGRHIVEKLITYHYVTLFNRGTNSNLFPNILKIIGDRNNKNDINKLQNKKFDCVIDVSGYNVNQVSPLIDVIKDNIPYYIYISSTAAINPTDDYAKGKKECEDVIIKKYDNYLILRPYYLCGNYDYTNRFDYSKWPDVYFENSDMKIIYDDVSDFSDMVVNVINLMEKK